MFHYEKKLQFPVKIATPNPKLAAFIISQYGGPYSVRLQKAGAKRASLYGLDAAPFPSFMQRFTAIPLIESDSRRSISPLQTRISPSEKKNAAAQTPPFV